MKRSTIAVFLMLASPFYVATGSRRILPEIWIPGPFAKVCQLCYRS